MDPVISDLRRYEAQQVREDIEGEERRKRVEEELNKLILSRREWAEAIQGVAYEADEDLSDMYRAYLENNDEELGKLFREHLNKDLRKTAENLVD